MTLKFKKLHPDAVLPAKAHASDAAFDLTAVSTSENGALLEIRFGLAVEIPAGYFGLILPRSSNFRTGNILSNSAGVIDSGYRGELKAIFYRYLDAPVIASRNSRLAQLIILPLPTFTPTWADQLSESDRGSGGFGSTGR